ncbi:peptidoglycan editing factor PgeF [Oceanithermus sp.]
MNLLVSPLLTSRHGFSGRGGGVSSGPFASLNLSLASGDEEYLVQENRRRLLAAFGSPPLARLEQVHGTTVHLVEGPGVWEGDGLVTATPGLALAVSVADCYPLLLEDPASGAVAALHAGWRGTLGNILDEAVGLLQRSFDSRPEKLRLAVGPGIGGTCYQVDADLADRFALAGWAGAVLADPAPGKARLDLTAVIRTQALAAGLRLKNLWFAGVCTHCHPGYFSYRRDGRRSGRQWGLIVAG